MDTNRSCKKINFVINRINQCWYLCLTNNRWTQKYYHKIKAKYQYQMDTNTLLKTIVLELQKFRSTNLISYFDERSNIVLYQLFQMLSFLNCLARKVLKLVKYKLHIQEYQFYVYIQVLISSSFNSSSYLISKLNQLYIQANQFQVQVIISSSYS